MRTLFGAVLDVAGLPYGTLGRFVNNLGAWVVLAVAVLVPTFHNSRRSRLSLVA